MSDLLMGSGNFRRFRRLLPGMGRGVHSMFQCRIDWIAACVRKSRETVRILVARLERAFSNFAQVPYHDVRARREFEELLDELEDFVRIL